MTKFWRKMRDFFPSNIWRWFLVIGLVVLSLSCYRPFSWRKTTGQVDIKSSSTCNVSNPRGQVLNDSLMRAGNYKVAEARSTVRESAYINIKKAMNQKQKAAVKELENHSAAPISDEVSLGIAAGGDLIFYSQEKLDHYFYEMKQLGVKWVRWDLDWSVIQSDNFYEFNWEGSDRVVKTAARFGIQTLGLITYAPLWAEGEVCGLEHHYPPQDPAAFASFARAVAERYRDHITYFEIWNEPNLSGFWYPRPDPARYGELLRLSYQEIKKARPDAVIISGGLSPASATGEGEFSTYNFVEYLYQNGYHKYFDAVALHPYTYPGAPANDDPDGNWQIIYRVRDLMVSYGDSDKKIWLTEFGAPTGGRGSVKELDDYNFTYGRDFMSENAQAESAVQAAALTFKEKSWMGPFFWYSLKDLSDDRSTPENFFGVIRFDDSRKPCHSTLKKLFNQDQ